MTYDEWVVLYTLAMNNSHKREVQDLEEDYPQYTNRYYGWVKEE